ncbi:MAG: hypothetical protein HZC40_18505 [Chloroflexi bacterium]|nr:hypothetical protein [Chloroflexota bacterium]
MFKRLVGIFPLIVALMLTSNVAIAQTDDPHFRSKEEEDLISCANELNNGKLPVDFVLPNGAYDASFFPPTKVPKDLDEIRCSDYTWLSKPDAAFLTVTPTSHGRMLSTRDRSEAQARWDCSHSFITYAVFGRRLVGFFRYEWVYAGGGQLYGNWGNGKCTHSVSQFPGWGKDTISVPYRQYGVRIAVQSWSHNSDNFGHTGADCPDLDNCYWTTTLRISSLPSTTRRVTISGSMFILDDESWPFSDEKGTFSISESRTLSPSNRRAEIFMKHCVGDEVRVELNFILQLEGDNTTVSVTGQAKLFEGTNCVTRDKEDSKTFAMKLTAGASQATTIKLKNRGVGGGDYANINFSVLNGQ